MPFNPIICHSVSVSDPQCLNHCILNMWFIIWKTISFPPQICPSSSSNLWGLLLNWLIDILHPWGPFQKYGIYFHYVGISVKFSDFLHRVHSCKCDFHSYSIMQFLNSDYSNRDKFNIKLRLDLWNSLERLPLKVHLECLNIKHGLFLEYLKKFH